jgi:hypothetical protein
MDEQTAVAEHIKLQNEFLDYVKKNGFSFADYCAPKPGSFYEKYRKRWDEIGKVIAPELKYHGQK